MMDREDLELFERSIAHTVDAHDGAALERALGELGWADASALDPRNAVGALFARLGLANRATRALEWVMAETLGVDDATAIVLPPPGSWAAPGRLVGGALEGHGLLLGAPTGAVGLVAVAGEGWTLTTVAHGDVDVRPVEGMDATIGLVEVRSRAAGTGSCPVDWPSAVAAGQRALAHQLIGAARAMADLARTHALERIQFGVPIASFQAVRHRLAETLVAIEMAEALLDSAWQHDDPTTTAMAKAVAGRSAKLAAKHCQQVLAGIGFTTEHAFHRYFRRVHVLDELLGSSRLLTRDLGRRIAATRQLPPVQPL